MMVNIDQIDQTEYDTIRYGDLSLSINIPCGFPRCRWVKMLVLSVRPNVSKIGELNTERKARP